MTFATASDLASYLQQDVDTATAELLLDLATGAIQSATGQTVEQVTDDAVTVAAPSGEKLVLPERPASTPTLVKVDGSAVTDYYADVPDDPLEPTVLYRPGGWEAWDSVTGTLLRVEVTYTHGYATIPAEIKGICLDVAARAYRNPEGLRSRERAVDDYRESDTYATETVGGSVMLSPSEVRAARRALGLPSARAVSLR